MLAFSKGYQKNLKIYHLHEGTSGGLGSLSAVSACMRMEAFLDFLAGNRQIGTNMPFAIASAMK